ncbi:TonB-dependent receptor [Paraglaciecola chathamensis]|uniref:Iron complex outermembrane recepter protein n=1 Tax=Paraglaciecola chathamensis S18K6 TaxID=1127672 RepID=A0AAV3UW65_9ALTE|nr:TonB-dependent receptor [Paraglaciecola chathamensis]GAC09320.1 iron complex outermembrane recepter protein [Paraglaciecola chathamensis S18K6]
MSRTKTCQIAPLSLRSPKVNTNKTLLALSVPGMLMSPFAMAQEDEPIVLDTMQIEERTVDTNPYAQAGAPYKAQVSGDSRHVKELADTPQTISVLTQTQIQESGKTDLKDILAAQPGITLGTGENGNAFGDRYIIRGHEARSDVFVDGLRDPGMTTRESFATEQVEITKGPSSTFAGRGSTGGAVNSITKQASTEYDFSKLEAGLGTDDYRRIALDSNKRINDDLAVRANILHSYKEIPDRGPADQERNGLALSVDYKATDKLKLTADYYYLKAEDTPDLGTYIVAGGGKPVADLPVYSQDGQDFLESEINTFTLRAQYEIDSNTRVENLMRYGTTDNGYVTTGARGTNRDATDPDAPGAATVSLSTHQGWQEVDYFADQLNVYLTRDLGGLKHNFVVSAEYSALDVDNGVYNVTNTGETNCITAGRRGASEGFCIVDTSGNYIDNISNVMGRSIEKGAQDSDYSIDTVSVSLMDTVDINEFWSVFAGVRADSFDYENVVTSGGVDTAYDYSDTLWNGHVGVVYNINEDANVYLTYSTSSNINGGESDLGGNCGYGGICGDPQQVTDSKPEDTENFELGTKWNVFNDKLLLTAAIFQITKDDVMESIGDDDYASLGTLNTGKNRVKGAEFSVVGNITEDLSTQFGVTFMDAEVLESFDTDSVGRTLSNFADNSAFWQLRYQASDAFSFGGTMTYSSEMYAGQPDSGAGFNTEINDYSYKVPSYTSFDVFATYAFSEQLNLRLNVANVTDKDYYLAAYRSGAFTYIGAARNAKLTLTYEF